MTKEKENERAKTPRTGSKNKRTGFYAALYSSVGLMLAAAVIIGFNRLGGPQADGGLTEARGTPPATQQPTQPPETRATPTPAATQPPEGQATPTPEATPTPQPTTEVTPGTTPEATPQPNVPAGQLGHDGDYCDCCDSLIAEVFAPGTAGNLTQGNAAGGNLAHDYHVWEDYGYELCCCDYAAANPPADNWPRDYDFSPFAQYHSMNWPVGGEVIMAYGSGIGERVFCPTLYAWVTNYNIAIAAPVGNNVQAAATGRVTDISNTREYGTKVVIEHGNGWVTTYSQLDSNVRVSVGYVVNRGDVIGFVGEPSIPRSGLASHVGFQVLHNDSTVNPVSVLMDR